MAAIKTAIGIAVRVVNLNRSSRFRDHELRRNQITYSQTGRRIRLDLIAASEHRRKTPYLVRPRLIPEALGAPYCSFIAPWTKRRPRTSSAVTDERAS